MIGTGKYVTRFGGEAYGLSLRLAPDGYIPAWEDLAAQQIVEGFVLTDSQQLPDDFFADIARVARLMNLICEEAAAGGFVDAAVPGERTPIPWRRWDEIEGDTIKAMVRDFFFSCSPRMTQLSPSKTFIGLPMATLLESVFGPLTQATETPV